MLKNKENIKDIRNRLFELQEQKYKEFQEKLCNTCKYEIIGVRMPNLRKLAKEIVKQDFRLFLENDEIKYYEEAMLKGLIIGISNMSFDETCKYLTKFIPTIDNWAVCDITCSGMKIAKRNMNEMWKFLERYVTSNKEYEIRFAIVMYLTYYIDKEYLDNIFNIIENINNKEYYVKMAEAWLISIAYVKEKDMTVKFLNKTKINKWTYNKALQKIIESYRVSDKEKVKIKLMKK